MMEKTRENNFDLLRVVAMIAVIMVHVSATWISGISSMISAGETIEIFQSPMMVCVYNSISRFAVPCFLMLSGAFLLDDTNNRNYLWFYKKSFYKIGVPTIIFTIIYILYRIPFCFVGEQRGLNGLIVLGKNIVTGAPMAHMWYCYMLVGVYLLVPLVIRFKETISEKTFYIVSVIFLIIASISWWTTVDVKLNWDLGQSFEYLGYLMVGYTIRKNVRKINNKKGLGLILLGLIMELPVAFLEYYDLFICKNSESRITAPYSPIIVLASCLIFMGVSRLRIPCSNIVGRMSKISFIVYLVHGGYGTL